MNIIFKSVLTLSFVSLLNKITGFGREVALAHFFGATSLMDDFLFADLVPNFIIYMMQGGLVTAFIPIYNKLLAKNALSDAKKLVDLLITFIILSLLLACACLYGFGSDLIKVITPKFSNEHVTIIIKISALLLPVVLFNGVFNVLRAVLEANGSFFMPAISLTVSNMIIILSIIVLVKPFGIYSIPIGMLLASIIQTLIQIFSCRKFYSNYAFSPYFKSDLFVDLIRATIPIMIGNFSAYAIMFNSRFLASYLNTGSISCLNYATKLQLAIFGFMIYPTIMVIYPRLIKMFNNEGANIFENRFNMFLNNGVLVITPILAFLYIHSEFIVKVVFERGAFDHQSTIITSIIFKYLIISIVFMYINEMISRYFYINNEFKIPNIVVIIGVIINISISLFFIDKYGIFSLVYSNLIASVITTLLLFICKNYFLIKNTFVFKHIVFFLIINSMIFYLFQRITFYKVYFGNLLDILIIGVEFFVYLLLVFYLYLITKMNCKTDLIFKKINEKFLK